MKKTLLSLVVMGGYLVSMGQSGARHDLRTPRADGNQTGTSSIHVPQQPASSGARGTAFWSEDFSGGSIPAGWTNTDTGSEPTEVPVTFVWSNDPAAVAVAALGYQPSSTFMAPSATNGYLWANSDRGLPAAPALNHLTRLTTTAIDCSSQSSVLLTMAGLIGVFDLGADLNALVRVSTDLSNWTTYQPFPCLVTGAAAPPCSRWSANPQNIELDISATAAGQSTVYIQWQWEGGWEYFWAIDDIALTDVPPYSRGIVSTYVSHTGDGYEYARIPSAQFGGNFTLGGDVRNTGLNAQTNVTLSADVNGGLFGASQNFATVNPGETVTMLQTPALPGAMAEGMYSVNFAVTSNEDANEANPVDDVATRNFMVDNFVYAIDGVGVHDASILNTTSLGSNSFTGGEDGVYFMSLYRLSQPVTAYGVQIMIDAATVPGGYVIVSLHDTTPVFADNMNLPLVESDPIDVTAQHVSDGFIWALFQSPYSLPAGAYYASAQLFSNAGAAHIRIVDDVTIGQPSDASLINIPGDQTYTNGNATAVRLGLVNNVSVGSAQELEGVSIFPNPSNGVLNVRSSKLGSLNIEVMDMTGRRVLNTRSNGTSVLDLTAQAKGIYMVRVSDATGSMIQRVTLD